jgi:hypothetical protein
MTPENDEQGWDSYRRMIVGWHNDDVKSHERIDSALTAIQDTLTVMRTERKVSIGALNFIVPAIVALASVGVARALGW